MHHHHRRRKKRPNYGTRTIEIQRGLNGLGFILSGQQPCILSCIVSNSPADLAGLRAGDFLISVNGLNVSKLPHESVVQLIGSSYGTIRMQIAENYFSDSSDEENITNNQVSRVKPRYLHHKLKMNRLRNSPQKIRTNCTSNTNFLLNSFIGIENVNPSTSGTSLRPVIEDVPPLPEISNVQNLIHSPPNSSTSKVSNIRAMIRSENETGVPAANINSNLMFDLGPGNEINTLEYRAIVGYLGTIEMPKQIATSSKLQTVRSCIRKLRQEKRNPTTVLMTILPNCLTLKNSNSIVLATYPSSRLNYVSSSSESENRFFGLVTSVIYANTNDDDPLNFDGDIAAGGIQSLTRDVIISNSCHVFVIDTKICDHIVHEQRATEYQITCTKDPISNLCLEFPNNSEYVVNLIRSMYTMKVLPPIARNFRNNDNGGHHGIIRNPQDPQANSPQPSNHSEITTTSSNSDSGIGFHNDCTNISDRILVVDFPGLLLNRICAGTNNDGVIGCGPISGPPRPLAICNDIVPDTCANSNLINNEKIITPMKSVDYRLNVRAMPDPKVNPNNKIPDLLKNFNLMKNLSSPSSSNLITTRSCDDVISSVERNDFITMRNKKQIQMSMDDITLMSGCGDVVDNNTVTTSALNNCTEKEHIFIVPGKPLRKNKKLPCTIQNDQPKNDKDLNNLISYKLSPKVFGVLPKKQMNSNSFENVSKKNNFNKIENSKIVVVDNVGGSADKNSFNDFEIWGSLQELNKTDVFEKNNGNFVEGTYSEPDLMSRALPSSTSPFRRWGQSSFRAPRTTETRPTLGRRPSSLAASENDVYTKSMDEFIDDINSVHSSHSGGVSIGTNLQGTKNLTINTNSSIPTKQNIQNVVQYGGVQSWGNSFEKLLEDPAGLHTFAEFLKKEFSAENIYFWTACERYRLLDNDKERATKAMEIFSKHLDGGCTEPVNVDSQARNIAEENLNIAERNLFSQAQKQIFNLMKFDSYQRFIRSDLYKKCIDAESKNQPLPYPGELLDENLRTGNLICPGPSKLKKSASNAEDRRRKSLLPWHRKARCKSRDRANTGDSESTQSLNKSQSSANNSLKQLPILTTINNNNTNSTSDLHSSRSSLSSFDTNTTNGFIGSDEYPLCRVILSDGATTIVPTRPDETIRQLIERLLEKRGIQYQFFDVVYNGQTKAIDLDKPANILASKEVQIEQRVAFKLDLPDPKVISVKSKPKKQLCDVIKPILHKYNYCFNDVQILMRDTHEQLDLTLPVTVADGQRLQVVMLKNTSSSIDANLWQQQQKIRNGIGGGGYQQFTKNNLTGNLIKPLKSIGSNTNGNSTQQSTLDEITNKVFNELLQGKVESHATSAIQAKKSADLCSLRSDDCTSETSSIFDRLRRRDSNIPGLKNFKTKKTSLSSYNNTNNQQNKLLTTQSDETLSTITQNTSGSDPTSTGGIKKPLIAKWKTGVKLQVTGRPQNQSGHNQDEFLEGLKRAQRARLEDQRGTEINFELPDFLKDKANLSAANKLRKIRANLSPVNQSNNNNSQNASKLLTQSHSGQLQQTPTGNNNNTDNLITNNRNSIDASKIYKDRPQPAPRLSISKSSSSVAVSSPNSSSGCSNNTLNNSSMGQDTTTTSTTTQSSAASITDTSNDLEYLLDGTLIKGPPPLPPKPKILPIKPSNWGQNNTGQVTNATSTTTQSATVNSSKIPIDITRRTLNNNNNNMIAEDTNPSNIYLDQPSSSFV